MVRMSSSECSRNLARTSQTPGDLVIVSEEKERLDCEMELLKQCPARRVDKRS